MKATKTVKRMVLVGSQMSILDWNCFSQLLTAAYRPSCRRQFAGSLETYNGLLRTTGKERGKQLGNKNITCGKKRGGRVASFFVFLPLRTVFGNLETRDALSSQMLWCSLGDYVFIFIYFVINYFLNQLFTFKYLFIHLLIVCLFLLFYLASCQILSVYRRRLSSFITSFNQRNHPPYWNWVRFFSAFRKTLTGDVLLQVNLLEHRTNSSSIFFYVETEALWLIKATNWSLQVDCHENFGS